MVASRRKQNAITHHAIRKASLCGRVVSPLQLGARAAVESSECPPPGARNALSPLVVEASSRLSEREEEEPGRDRLEVERRMRCQVGREVQSPVDERVGDQYAEQDRSRQLCEAVSQSV